MQYRGNFIAGLVYGLTRGLGAAAVVASLLVAAEAAAAEGVKDLNAIIRALAPIEYLPEHSGRKRAIDLDIGFALDSATLAAAATAQLDELAAALNSEKLAASRFRLAGHTDASGPAAYNQALSQRRAASVKAYLVERHGVDPARLETVGWGEEKLKDPLAPEAAVNRRVEVALIEDAAATPPEADQPKQMKIKW